MARGANPAGSSVSLEELGLVPVRRFVVMVQDQPPWHLSREGEKVCQRCSETCHVQVQAQSFFQVIQGLLLHILVTVLCRRSGCRGEVLETEMFVQGSGITWDFMPVGKQADGQLFSIPYGVFCHESVFMSSTYMYHLLYLECSGRPVHGPHNA